MVAFHMDGGGSFSNHFLCLYQVN